MNGATVFPVLQWEGKAGKLWALAMTSLENVTKRGEGRLWAAALGLSLLCNAGLLLVGGMAFVDSHPFDHPSQPTPPPSETLHFIAPEIADSASAPASAPASAAAIAEAAVQAAKEVLTPEHVPGFAHTSDDQRGKRPDHPAFIGERDTVATSDATPDPSAPAMPAQTGVQPRHPGDFETTESNYQDGALRDSVAPASESPQPPDNPSTPAARSEANAAPVTPASPVPPARLAVGPNPVDIPVPVIDSPQAPAPGVQTEPRTDIPDGLPTADAIKETKVTPARQDLPKDPAFRGNQRKTAIQGSISRSGRSALDVGDSPLGRYQASIGRAVELEWQRNLVRNRDLITPGYLTVRFFVDAKGKVRNVQCVGAMQTGQLQKSFTLASIRDAAIPAMSAELSKDFQDEPLELTLNFYF